MSRKIPDWIREFAERPIDVDDVDFEYIEDMMLYAYSEGVKAKDVFERRGVGLKNIDHRYEGTSKIAKYERVYGEWPNDTQGFLYDIAGSRQYCGVKWAADPPVGEDDTCTVVYFSCD